ncbi:hypothetical protein D3C77_405790 [compost metagenome]
MNAKQLHNTAQTSQCTTDHDTVNNDTFSLDSSISGKGVILAHKSHLVAKTSFIEQQVNNDNRSDCNENTVMHRKRTRNLGKQQVLVEVLHSGKATALRIFKNIVYEIGCHNDSDIVQHQRRDDFIRIPFCFEVTGNRSEQRATSDSRRQN